MKWKINLEKIAFKKNFYQSQHPADKYAFNLAKIQLKA